MTTVADNNTEPNVCSGLPIVGPPIISSTAVANGCKSCYTRPPHLRAKCCGPGKAKLFKKKSRILSAALLPGELIADLVDSHHQHNHHHHPHNTTTMDHNKEHNDNEGCNGHCCSSSDMNMDHHHHHGDGAFTKTSTTTTITSSKNTATNTTTTTISTTIHQSPPSYLHLTQSDENMNNCTKETPIYLRSSSSTEESTLLTASSSNTLPCLVDVSTHQEAIEKPSRMRSVLSGLLQRKNRILVSFGFSSESGQASLSPSTNSDNTISSPQHSATVTSFSAPASTEN